MSQSSNPVQLRDLTRTAVVVTLVLLAAHLWSASRLEFMFDEAYYTLWSRHPAWGYHDHPPAVAAWIWASTKIFGPSEFGARALGAIVAAIGALGIYVIALDLFADRGKASLAALLWSACPLIGVGAILVTPDTPLLVGWFIALWGLGRIFRTADWRWWLVVGLGAGLALEAKYSALFLGPGILLALSVVPDLRHWLRHPAPYAGGVVAFAMFAPNIVWNARHGWQTFLKQFGRVADAEWTLRFIGEFLGSQIGLLNPLTFVLVIAGLNFAVRWPTDGTASARRLLTCLAAPLLAFFVEHSLHDRVQGNWVAPLYPVFVLLAADAAGHHLSQPVWAGRLLAVARAWAVPLGLTLTALIYAQAYFALFPLPPQADPTALVSGWRQLARDVETTAERENAGYILTQGYALTGLLKFYNPVGRPVFQYNERQRWAYDPSEGQPDAAGAGLFIVDVKRTAENVLRTRFREVVALGQLDRKGHGKLIETYTIFRVAGPKVAILDPFEAPRR